MKKTVLQNLYLMTVAHLHVTKTIDVIAALALEHIPILYSIKNGLIIVNGRGMNHSFCFITILFQ